MESGSFRDISCRHKVHYYETDKMGIVHHSNYIRWFEEARVEFLDKIGFGYKELEELGIVSPVLHITCDYKSMTHFGDEIVIIPTVKMFNGVKLTIYYVIRDDETGEIRAEGESRHCFLDNKGLPVRLKKVCPEFYEILTGVCG